MDKPSVKILVVTHKPALFPEGECFVPIQAGRDVAIEKTKDGKLCQKDLNWLLENTIGDNTGDNISGLNRSYSEMTAVYWAWKNYGELGNPDYIGLCHYRRLFEPDEFINNIEKYDIYLPKASVLKEHIDTQFIEAHSRYGLNILKEAVERIHPEDKIGFDKFLGSKKLNLYNMFVMRKEIFFEYANWIFGVLNYIHKTVDYTKLSVYNQHFVGFCAERLTSYFIQKKEKEVKVKELQVYENNYSINDKFPIENSNPENIPIIFASDDKFSVYTGVCIESILSNANPDKKYDFYVLSEGLKEENAAKLKSVTKRYKNASLTVINVTPIFKTIKKSSLFASGRYNITTYYRFFIQDIFKNFEKVLYLDGDIIVNGDISELYNTDISNYCLGAVRDLYMKVWRPQDIRIDSYLKNILKLKPENDYFQAGVLLINNKKFVEDNIFDKLISKLEEVKSPKLNDQDILNTVLQSKVLYLGNEWNYDWNIETFNRRMPNSIEIELKSDDYLSYVQSKQSPKIIHYAGRSKPWTQPSIPLSEYFWKYARKVDFYEEILYANLKDNNTQTLDSIIQKIFSIKNAPNGKHKVVTILGIKIELPIKNRRVDFNAKG